MKKIVLLNDELGTQMQIYLALCDVYRVEIAENIESAMYMLRKYHPQILLMDYHLEHLKSNGKNGVDFIKKVKKKYQDLKVMLILEGADRNYADKIQSDCVDGVICKPIKNRQLISYVRKLSTPTEMNILNSQATA